MYCEHYESEGSVHNQWRTRTITVSTVDITKNNSVDTEDLKSFPDTISEAMCIKNSNVKLKIVLKSKMMMVSNKGLVRKNKTKNA